MKKSMYKLICSLAMAIIMISNMNVRAFAASDLIDEIEVLEVEVSGRNDVLPEMMPYATTFMDASITISFDSEGMYIDICTGMNGIASVVGAKDIEVHRKTLFSYEVVAVADGGELYNTTTVLNSMVYRNAVQGQKYRVVCTHYGDVDGYREMYAETDWVTCNY